MEICVKLKDGKLFLGNFYTTGPWGRGIHWTTELDLNQVDSLFGKYQAQTLIAKLANKQWMIAKIELKEGY